jgi:hypothetical protein
MFFLFYFSRHKRISNHAGRNDTMLSRTSFATRRNLPYRKLSFQPMIAMLFGTILMLLVYKITKLQNHVPLSSIHALILNKTYHITTLHTPVLSSVRPNIRDDNIQSINAIVNTNVSSVDYMACCGAGHRISKMADAYYLAQKLNFTLRGYWGYCDTVATTGHLTEVFQYVYSIHISDSTIVHSLTD